jgi:predicted glycoside hydrolase/deacetylase ChbG (UPF0249 family)
MTEKQIVIHHDDLGGSHGANAAFVELWDLGIVTSGAVMVPCGWFPEIAMIARARPELDLGVHLTLTSEFSKFRWRPLTGVADNGLCDPDGFFWPDVAHARRADPAAVERELRAQIETALAAGIDITHFDSHMGTVWMPELIDIYVRLGEDYRVPVALTGDTARMGADAAQLEAAFGRLRTQGAPVFETYLTTPFGSPEATEPKYREILGRAQPGLNWGAFHFTAPGDMDLFSDDIRLRTTEYDMFRSGRGKALLDEAGLTLVGMRELRDRMRAG